MAQPEPRFKPDLTSLERPPTFTVKLDKTDKDLQGEKAEEKLKCVQIQV